MATYKMCLEYDGTDFVGWQYQTNGRSVQDEVEKALHRVLGEEIRIAGAGRTDAGVHARGQVASFQTERVVDCHKLKGNLNGVLPADVVIREIGDAAEGFHARFTATSRRYAYRITTRPAALERRFAWALAYELDLGALASCAAMLVGKHDFSSFCRASDGEENHICHVYDARWNVGASSRTFHIVANRFLHGMVRGLVGTMIEVGRGMRKPSEFQEILAARDRRRAGMSAPSHGLCLEEVSYTG